MLYPYVPDWPATGQSSGPSQPSYPSGPMPTPRLASPSRPFPASQDRGEWYAEVYARLSGPLSATPAPVTRRVWDAPWYPASPPTTPRPHATTPRLRPPVGPFRGQALPERAGTVHALRATPLLAQEWAAPPAPHAPGAAFFGRRDKVLLLAIPLVAFVIVVVVLSVGRVIP